jgi:hypothetical protein
MFLRPVRVLDGRTSSFRASVVRLSWGPVIREGW